MEEKDDKGSCLFSVEFLISECSFVVCTSASRFSMAIYLSIYLSYYYQLILIAVVEYTNIRVCMCSRACIR